MSQIELSAGLHATNGTPLKTMLTNTEGVATASTSDTAERQQSGHSCSTSSPAIVPPSVMRKPSLSSVRSRAAFFEAIIASPSASSPPRDSCSPPASPIQPKHLILSRSVSGPPRVPLAASSGVAGQEVEMVDQGAQEPTETLTLNQLAGHAQLSSDTPARPRLTRRSLSDIKHGSYSEIQSQSCTDHSGGSHATSAEPKWPETAAALEGSSNVLDADAPGDEHGIELQEQGHVEMLEHALERLQAELAERQKQSVSAASALACKTQECESLMRIVRELTENRSKLVCARTNLAEKLAEMQHEYMRLMRVADLSRVVSKENVAKTAKVMKTLKQVQDESARQQHLIGYFKERNKNLKEENSELRERLCLLERLDLLSYSRDSACMREFKVHALKETY